MSRRNYNYKAAFERVTQWAFFTVGITLAPLILSYAQILLNPQTAYVSLYDGFSPRGELLIASAAILGEAISDLLKRALPKNFKLFWGGLCVLLLIITCLLYAAIQSRPNANQSVVSEWSYTFFIFSLALGLYCKVI